LNQRSAEVKLITAMLSIEGGFAETKLKGITAEHFNLFGEVYKFICDHEANYNSLPTKGMIIEKFTDFIFAKREFSSISDVVYYIDIIKNFYVKKMAERIISEGIDKLKVEDPTEAVRFMTESLLKVHKPNIRMSHTDHDVNLRLEEFIERKKQIERGESIGIKTGLSMFDEKMMGWQPGDFIVVYGPPQVGKSWMLEYFGIMAYLDGHRVLFISTEMSYQEVNLRWDTIASRKLGFDLPNEALLTGSDAVKLSTYKAWVEKAQQRDDWLTVDSAEGDNFRVSTVEGLVDSFHPDVVCCDTLPLFCDSQGKLGVSWDSLLEIGYGLKSLASRRNLVIISTNPSTGDTFDQDKPAGLSGIAFSRAGLPFAASVMISINYDKMDPIGHRQISVTKKRHGKAIGGARKIVYDLDRGIIGDV
jgi:archaellum biogenesis ATPase FlaH